MTKVFLMRVPQLSKDQVKALGKIHLPSHVDRSRVDLKIFSTPRHESEDGHHFKVYQHGGAIADVWASSENNLIHYLKEHRIGYYRYTQLH